MEEVKIEVVSKCIVKPSSPTPPDLKHYQLSFLDQMSPHVYTSLVLFYTAPDIVLSRLKTSLSETLTLFYPLAGRHKGTTFIDCNDQGIPCIETRVVNSRLSDAVRNPDPRGLRKFVPFVLDYLSDVILAIQFNVFEDCGGIAIGLCISHRIADGLSMVMFTKTWAAICRGAADRIPSPEFVSAKLFPPITELEEPIDNTTTSTKKKIFSKRFVFKSDAIESLKAIYSDSSPSRVGVLSAFIWSRIAAATQVHSDPAKPCTMIQTVNLRTRSEPTLPEHSFGNLYRIVITMYASPDAEGSEYVELIPKMREATRTIDAEYVRKLGKGEDQVYFMMKRMSSQYGNDHHFKVNVISFTSFCRFPMYASDFGWGKPIWVGVPSFPVDNLVVFADTESGDGIEAYVNWNEEDIAKLEKDEKFQAHISQL